MDRKAKGRTPWRQLAGLGLISTLLAGCAAGRAEQQASAAADAHARLAAAAPTLQPTETPAPEAVAVAEREYAPPRVAASYPPVRMVSDERLVADAGPMLPNFEQAAPPAVRMAELRPAATSPQRVVHAGDRDFERQVLQSELPVLVDFYAEWCGPCKSLAPTLDELAAESPQAKIVKVDIGDNPALAARYGVRSVPTLLVFRDGQVASRHTGGASKARLRSMLEP
jgi:thioredoxin 1